MEFKRIKKEIVKLNARQQASDIKIVRAAKTVEDINNAAERLIGRKITTVSTADKNKAREKLIAKIRDKYARELKKDLQRVDDIANAATCTHFRLEIEWTKGGIYGCQARANLATGWHYYEGKRTGGCGYDKGSTAAANVLNVAPEILKKLYEQEEKRLSKRERQSRRDFIGYGCLDVYGGNYYKPRFEGGVGLTSHITILKNCGYDVEWIDTKYADVIIGKLEKAK